MKYFCQTHFRELLAASIAGDAAFEAAAEAVERQLKASLRAIPDTLLLARLAEDSGFISPVPMQPALERLAACAGGLAILPEEILDLLAWQLHVEGYELAQDRAAKARIIQESLFLYRKKGTPWSLRRALEILIQRDVQIPEWFSYGGDPYYFRVRFDVSLLGFYPEQWQSLLSAIYDWKNVRSWLDGIWTYGITNMEHVFAAACRSLTISKCRLYFPPPEIPVTSMVRAVGLRSKTFARVRLFTPMPKARPAPHAAGIAGFTRSKVERLA